MNRRLLTLLLILSYMNGWVAHCVCLTDGITKFWPFGFRSEVPGNVPFKAVKHLFQSKKKRPWWKSTNWNHVCVNCVSALAPSPDFCFHQHSCRTKLVQLVRTLCQPVRWMRSDNDNKGDCKHRIWVSCLPSFHHQQHGLKFQIESETFNQIVVVHQTVWTTN